jgi:hypothetical protein
LINSPLIVVGYLIMKTMALSVGSIVARMVRLVKKAKN